MNPTPAALILIAAYSTTDGARGLSGCIRSFFCASTLASARNQCPNPALLGDRRELPQHRSRDEFVEGTRYDEKIINKREDAMSVLLVALGALVGIWIVVLLGSRFFGPADH